MAQAVDTGLSVGPRSLSSSSLLRRAAAVRWAVRATVAFVIFAAYHGLAYLDIFAAPRFLQGDWTTYVVSSNYLRTSPVLTVPIATVPGYIAPVGTNLGMTDALPVISPLYRVLLEVWPDRPIALVGWEVLVAIVLTFLTVARLLDAVTGVRLRPLPRELATLALATVATLAPFWSIQVGHPALMQQWIIVWALAGALRRCPTVLRGHLRPIAPGWTGLGPICVAAAVHPYLIPMAALPALAPDVARLRRAPQQVLAKGAVALISVVAISVILGYLGTGARLGSSGFGYYAADLATVLNPMGYSNWLGDLHLSPGADGGYGYLGVGALVLVAAGAVAAIVRVVARRSGSGPAPAPVDPWPARCLYLAIALLTTFAVLPEVRVFGHQVLDLTLLTRHVASATAVYRVNGRSVWPVLWLTLLLGTASALRAGRRAAACIVGGALVLQVGDAALPATPLRPPARVEYDAARRTLQTEIASGATSVQFQPPVVMPGCHAARARGADFQRLGDVLLAAAVLRLPVNSGYTARLVPRFVAVDCKAEAAAYRARDFDPRVVYVRPAAAGRIPRRLSCARITRAMLACRSRGREAGHAAPAQAASRRRQA
jgi:hypothetical protein